MQNSGPLFQYLFAPDLQKIASNDPYGIMQYISHLKNKQKWVVYLPNFEEGLEKLRFLDWVWKYLFNTYLLGKVYKMMYVKRMVRLYNGKVTVESPGDCYGLASKSRSLDFRKT